MIGRSHLSQPHGHWFDLRHQYRPACGCKLLDESKVRQETDAYPMQKHQRRLLLLVVVVMSLGFLLRGWGQVDGVIGGAINVVSFKARSNEEDMAEDC